MVNFLAAAGLVFVILAFWLGRSQATREREELAEYKKIKDELGKAKIEVSSLLEQLKAVSEKVVEEITTTVHETRRSIKETAVSAIETKGPEQPNENYSGTLEPLDNHREPQAGPGLNIKSASVRKTILFPRKKERSSAKPGIVNPREAESDVPVKHQLIYTMANLGYQEAEIAKQLDLGRGEVRLILQLKRKGEEVNG